MKLIGDLKKQVDNAKDISEKRSIIEKAGMKLSDDIRKFPCGSNGITGVSVIETYIDFLKIPEFSEFGINAE